MFRVSLPVLAALWLASLATSARANNIVVSVLPSLHATPVGNSFEVAIGIEGLGGGTALGAFDINVNFDAAQLAYQNASFGDSVLGDQLDLSSQGLNFPLATPGTGTVNLIETSLDPTDVLTAQQATAFTLATVTFIGLASGDAQIDLTLNSLSDASAGEITGAWWYGDVVSITEVPEPGRAIAVLSGLATILMVTRRRQRSGPLASSATASLAPAATDSEPTLGL